MRSKHSSSSDSESSVDQDSKITEKSPSYTTKHSTTATKSSIYSAHKPSELEKELLPTINKHQKFFTSINDCYSLFLLTHEDSPEKIQKVGLKTGPTSQNYVCICDKIFQAKHYFERHINQSHEDQAKKVKGLMFRHIRYELAKNNKCIGYYKAKQKEFAIDIKKAQYHEIQLTEEMTHMKKKLQEKMIKRCKSILQILDDQSLTQHIVKTFNIDQKLPFPFSRDLMRTLRKLVVDNIMVFDRRFDIYLKNMTLKQKTMIFVYKLSLLMDSVTEHENLKIFAKLTENVIRRFTHWIDNNYSWVLKKYWIPCTTEIAGKTYSECNRDENAKLFGKIYLKEVNQSDESAAFKLIVIVITKLFLLYSAKASDTGY